MQQSPVFNYSRPLWRPPTFNRTHSVASGTNYAGVAIGGKFLNLVDGKLSALSGAPVRAINGDIGEVGQCPSISDSFITAGVFPTLARTTVTLGSIFVATSTTNDPTLIQLGTTPSLLLYINFSGGGSRQWTWNGTAAYDSGLPSISLNAPYFAAVSQSNVTSVGNWVLRNLRTGKIFTSTSAAAGPGADTNGSVQIGSGAGLNVAAAFISSRFMGISQLIEIAKDPWALFYPAEMDPYDTLVGAAAAPAGASGRRLLLLRAG